MTDIQAIILSIFKYIDVLCRENKIPYYAIGGTCIGAIRHKGFIPWDDDLDIAIPIEYYDRFLELAAKSLPDHLEVFNGWRIKKYPHLFSKIVDNRTTFIETWERSIPTLYKGVFVDVMPLCGIPDNICEQESLLKRFRYLGMMNIFRRDIGGSKKRRIAEVLLCIQKPFVKFHAYLDEIYKLYRARPLNKSLYTGYVWHIGLDQSPNLIFNTKLFKDSVDIPFENTTISCPAGYHEYLTKQFGDYMIPPRHNEQKQHDGIVDLKRSFREYQQDKTLIKR